jgi:NAD(P)-dependent dehydrogenase (short-subunit alcohol dehydrogenase family)
VTGSATIDGDIAEILGQSLPWQDLDGATVLVTGAAGMIPAYAVYTLLGLNDVRDAGITVLALVRDPEKARRQFGSVADRSDLVLVQGDVRHPIEIDRRIDLVDADHGNRRHSTNPRGNGSLGSSMYCAVPVTHARPVIVGMTAGMPATSVVSTRRPVKLVPMNDSLTKSWSSGSSPRACS